MDAEHDPLVSESAIQDVIGVSVKRGTVETQSFEGPARCTRASRRLATAVKG